MVVKNSKKCETKVLKVKKGCCFFAIPHHFALFSLKSLNNSYRTFVQMISVLQS